MAVRNQVGAQELERYRVFKVELTGKVLGAGAYGNVEEVKIPGAKAAAKKLHTGLIDFGSSLQVRKWINDFVEECKFMSRLRHPNIVQFLGICYLPDSELPVLLMEKLLTSLDSLLEGTPNIPIEMKVHILTGAASGLVCLHSQSPPIAHRDLTARNILIDSNFNAKIADLGVSRMVTIQPGQLAATMTGGPGNLLYMPPEAQTSFQDLSTKYNVSIDIFSFGVTSLFTFTQLFPKALKPPNYFDPKTQTIVGLTEIQRREEYVEAMKAALDKDHPLVLLTLSCLAYLPQQRPSAEEVLKQLNEVQETLPKDRNKLELSRLIASKDSDLRDKDSIIEELQKATEQLKTANDKLEASNEEVQESYKELQAKVTEKSEQLSREEEKVLTLQKRLRENKSRERDKPKEEIVSPEHGTIPPTPASPPVNISVLNSKFFFHKPMITGRETVVAFHALTPAGRPCLINSTALHFELLHEITNTICSVEVDKYDINKFNLRIKPTLRGRYRLQAIMNDRHKITVPLVFAPDPAELGRTTTAIKGLNKPWSITINSKDQFIVTEVNSGEVKIFDKDWTMVKSFRNGCKSRGVTVDSEDNIFVCDSDRYEVLKFSPTGDLIKAVTCDRDSKFSFPDGIAFNKVNGLLYLANRYSNIVRVLKTDLTITASFTIGDNSDPSGICCAEDGSVFIADSRIYINAIKVYTSKGELVRQFGFPAFIPEKYQCPAGICISAGLVYICDSLLNRVAVFTISGEQVGEFGREGFGEGQLVFPAGVFVDKDQKIYIADCNAYRVQIF